MAGQASRLRLLEKLYRHLEAGIEIAVGHKARRAQFADCCQRMFNIAGSLRGVADCGTRTGSAGLSSFMMRSAPARSPTTHLGASVH